MGKEKDARLSKLFNSQGNIRRPTEETALANIAKRERHQRNLRLFTGWYKGRFYRNGQR